MKKYVNRKNAVRLTVFGVGLTAVSMLYMTGCGGDGTASICSVPLEANLNTTVPARIGGATTAVELFKIGDEEWTFFNISNELRAAQGGRKRKHSWFRSERLYS